MFKSLTPLLSIMTAIVLFVFFTKPLYEEAKMIDSEVAQYRETIDGHGKFQTELQRLKQTKNEVQTTNRERIEAMIPEVADTTQTLVDLESMARAQGLLFGNVAVEEGEFSLDAGLGENAEMDTHFSSRNLVTQSISFEVIGTYEQFKAFLVSLESSLTFMEVTGISLSAATDLFQQYAVTIETYSLPKS